MDGDYEICVINSDGTGYKQLTSNTADDWYASISDDGTKIAYTSDVNGDNEIFVIINNLPTPITTPEAGFNFPIEYTVVGIAAMACVVVLIFLLRRK